MGRIQRPYIGPFSHHLTSQLPARRLPRALSFVRRFYRTILFTLIPASMILSINIRARTYRPPNYRLSWSRNFRRSLNSILAIIEREIFGIIASKIHERRHRLSPLPASRGGIYSHNADVERLETKRALRRRELSRARRR